MEPDKGKKQKIAEKDKDENNNSYHIDRELVLSIEKLQEIQDELEKINEEASDKVLEIEQKYNEIRKPIYHKRTDIVQSIPDFWSTAFMSHPVLGELLTEEDQKIFRFLSSIEVEDSKDVKSGYLITFYFNSNPYFEDAKLTKTFTFHEEGTTTITATSIKWKEGMGLPHGSANEEKGKKRSHSEESFFTWFSDSQQKDEDLDEIHDEVAEIIKEDLWPNPLTYFNTDADEEDGDEEEGDDEEKGSDDTEDDDDDVEDDDEDENGDEE